MRLDLGDLVGAAGVDDLLKDFLVGQIEEQIKAAITRMKTDRDRVQLFSLACTRWYADTTRKTIEAGLAGNFEQSMMHIDEIGRFTKASADFLGEWVDVIEAEAQQFRKANLFTVWKLLGRLVGYDPLKPLREKAREFVKEWRLGEDVAEALGVKAY